MSSGVERRIRRLEKQLGVADASRIRAEILHGLESGQLQDGEILTMYHLMSHELRVSLLLAASWMLDKAEEIRAGEQPQPERVADMNPWPVYGAAMLVAMPPDYDVPPWVTENIKLFDKRPKVMARRARSDGLSASEREDVALFLRARLMKLALGEPTGMALRRELYGGWKDDPPDADLYHPEPEEEQWIAEVRELLRLDWGMPIIRGSQFQSRLYPWTTRFVRDPTKPVPEPEPVDLDGLIDYNKWEAEFRTIEDI